MRFIFKLMNPIDTIPKVSIAQYSYVIPEYPRIIPIATEPKTIRNGVFLIETSIS